MEEFDIQRLMDNINSIIQQKNIKIGEMESDIGVSPGYISRLTKKGNGAATSADLIWKVAKYLGVSVDFLMDGNAAKTADYLRYMQGFINKLMVCTESAELCWEPITTKYVNQIMAGGDGELFIVKECGKTEHVDNGNDLPIIEENTFSEDNYTYRRVKKNRIWSSAAPLEYVWLDGPGFVAKLNEETELYIFSMGISFGTDHGNIEDTFYDVYMRKYVVDDSPDVLCGNMGEPIFYWKLIPLCNTFNNASSIREDIIGLYNSASNHAYDIKLDADAKSFIDEFMGLI